MKWLKSLIIDCICDEQKRIIRPFNLPIRLNLWWDKGCKKNKADIEAIAKIETKWKCSKAFKIHRENEGDCVKERRST